MKKHFAAMALFALLFFGSAFAATITRLEAESVDLPNPALGNSVRTPVTIECYENGAKINTATATLNFYKSTGAPVGTASMPCSGGPTNSPALSDPGVYYVEAQLPGGPKEKAWFSVSRFFSGINVSDANPLAALVACISVLLIVGRKKKK